MKLYFVLLCTGFALGRPSSDDQPSFRWVESRSENGVPLLSITFPDGGHSDFASLSPFNPIPVGPNERSEDVDDCIYDGFLQNEQDVYVTVTGCPSSNSFEVQLNSKHHKNSMFKIVNGKTFALDFQHSNMLTMNDVERADPLPDIDVKQLEPLNADGYIASVKLHYDDNWDAKFGADSVNAARRVMAHAQNAWRWTSLTTKIIFNVHPDVRHLPGKWNAENSRSQLTNYNDPTVNTNIFLCVRMPDTPSGWAFGKGKSGGACSKYLSYHSVIMEYLYSDVVVARSLAHEIGHNLGIKHDFTDVSNSDPRFDAEGKSCLGVGGLMDYAALNENDKSRWSHCSVADFTKMMNSNKTCLQKIDLSNPPSSPAPPQLNDNVCDLSKNFPSLNGVHTLHLNGVYSFVTCISGYCSTFKTDDLNGCKRICGQDSCANISTLKIIS